VEPKPLNSTWCWQVISLVIDGMIQSLPENTLQKLASVDMYFLVITSDYVSCGRGVSRIKLSGEHIIK